MNAAGDWNFANAPADGPSRSRIHLTAMGRYRDRKPIDGVMMIDVHALASMLDAIGPADIHGLPFSLTSSNVVPFLTNGAYLLPGGGHVRRGYVGLAGLRTSGSSSRGRRDMQPSEPWSRRRQQATS